MTVTTWPPHPHSLSLTTWPLHIHTHAHFALMCLPVVCPTSNTWGLKEGTHFPIEQASSYLMILLVIYLMNTPYMFSLSLTCGRRVRYWLLAHVQAFPQSLGIHVSLEMVGKINMCTFNVIKICSSLPVEIPSTPWKLVEDKPKVVCCSYQTLFW